MTLEHDKRQHHSQYKQTGITFGLHCVKSVQIRSYFWCVFSCIRIELGDLRSKSPYSIRIQENTDQK